MFNKRVVYKKVVLDKFKMLRKFNTGVLRAKRSICSLACIIQLFTQAHYLFDLNRINSLF